MSSTNSDLVHRMNLGRVCALMSLRHGHPPDSLMLAVAQPIRLDGVVFLENEYGTIEEITTTYIVIKLWDWRMVVPVSYFIEKPFQNWTRETSALIGSVFLYVDYTAPVERFVKS